MIIHRLGRVYVIAGILLATAVLFITFFWSPAVEWDTSPHNRVITIGEVFTEVDYNYIPDVQIWGDGYIVWVEGSPGYKRRVLEGRLSSQELTLLFHKLIELDFFKVFRKGKDNAGVYITAILIGGSHSEWLNPEDKEIYEFATYLREGAGANGTELIPTTGTLFAIPIEKTWLPADTNANYHWPEDKFNRGLEFFANESNGTAITGEELEFAWEVVNSPLPIVESRGKTYWIAVKLPKISE
jgi:hypothetical protein